MKKLQVVFLFVLLAGCSSIQNDFPVVTQSIIQTSTPVLEQTAAPPTQTVTPTATLTPTVTATAIGGGGGKIAFTSERDGVPEIFVINPDGSNLIKLTNDITPKYDPSWSPDGKTIVFGTNDNDSASLYIMNADGSNPVKLVDTNDISTYDQASSDWRFEGSPLWSPDGTKLAFRVYYYIGCCFSNSYIHVVNSDGSELVGSTALPIWERFVWSPNSQKIAFGSACGGWGICVMNADGTDLINLTKSSAIDSRPSWSPDGAKIAFSSGRNGDREIFVMNFDGTNVINLTHYGSAWDGDPIWSPDGRKIAFSSYRDGNYEIYVMDADGSNQINLTNHSANDKGPIWSPDGTKIAFESERDRNSEIYVIDANGSNLLRLTNNDTNDYTPVWSP